MAIIPARGGSKRIPRKNVRLFCGKPMLVWSIAAAQESACFDRIIVSTDDDEIAEIAAESGAEVPFRRPAELADDYTSTTAVVAHAVWALEAQKIPQSLVCCIYATAPFLEGADLRRGLSELEQSGADYAFAVARYAFPIQRAIRITDSGRVEMLWPEHFNTRSQDLVPSYHDAGQFYWGRSRAWTAGTPIFSHSAVPVFMPYQRVQDIDTPEDWERAEWMFKTMILQGKR